MIDMSIDSTGTNGPMFPDSRETPPVQGKTCPAPAVAVGAAADPVIRNARETDLPDLLAMIRELASFENLEDELEVTAASLNESLFGLHPAAAALIAVAEGRPAGYAIYYHTFSSFVGRPGIFLDDIYVRPAFRRRGIGRALLKRVSDIGLRRHCGRFEWIALRWNEEALRFYEGLGARQLDQWVMLRLDEQGIKTLARAKGTPAV
jgi:GNAT superfamily N-acetyltransferase